MFYLYVCMYITCVPCTYRGEKRALDAVEQELQMDVSYYVGVES